MTFLIPPRSVSRGSGNFTFGGKIEIAGADPDDRVPILGLIRDLARFGVSARHTTNTASAAVRIVRKRAVVHPEGYRISVSPQAIEITAGTAAGAYYGIQTLRELIASEGPMIPAVQIEDEPAFARRGFYLDCSRGKVPTVQTLMEFVERLAHWKMNELQLYIENVFTFAKHPAIGEGFSPYTPEDILAVQNHCALHHVDFVPSLTSLGHFEKILMLPEYSELGELPGFRDLAGGTTLNPIDPKSLQLVADMYREFLPLFTAKDFNACGDEPWELGQGRSKERAEEIGVGRVYLDFILGLRELSLAHGKRMNLWGDIVLKHPEIIPEIPPDVVLLNWDYRPDGSMMLRTDEFAAAGLPLVCCPGTNGWQSHGTRLKMSMRDIHQFAQIASEHGAEGILNTDWGDLGHRNSLGVSLHGAAYGAACSWNPKETPGPEEDTFTQAFTRHTFGDTTGALVDVIKTIGDDDLGHWGYHALLESLVEPKGLGSGFSKARVVIDDVDLSDSAAQAKIEAAEALSVPTNLKAVTGESRAFERTALSEYALANLMNKACLRRLLMARKLRSGKTIGVDEVSTHREELTEIRLKLERLWLVRSRPSRLADSLAGFDEALAELDTIDVG